MIRSTQSLTKVGEDGCRYRTIIEEICKISGECQRSKRVFRKCPQDHVEVEIEAEGQLPSNSTSLKNKYDSIAQDV